MESRMKDKGDKEGGKGSKNGILGFSFSSIMLNNVSSQAPYPQPPSLPLVQNKTPIRSPQQGKLHHANHRRQWPARVCQPMTPFHSRLASQCKCTRPITVLHVPPYTTCNSLSLSASRSVSPNRVRPHSSSLVLRNPSWDSRTSHFALRTSHSRLATLETETTVPYRSISAVCNTSFDVSLSQPADES